MILNEKLISEYKVEEKHEILSMKLTNYRIFLTNDDTYKNTKYKFFYQDIIWGVKSQQKPNGNFYIG